MQYPVLKLNDISKKISPTFSLDHISLEVISGEVHALLGENGSGKSCILQIMSGILQPDGGEILLDNIPVKLPDLSASRKTGIIYIMQDPNLFEHMTIAENIYFYNMPYKNQLLHSIDYNKLNHDCKLLFDELKLTFNVHTTVSELGLAQRQIIEFCKAYVSNARVLILDEPAVILSDYEKEVLYTLIHRMKERGTAIVYVSHKLSEIQSIADRVTVIRRGQIVGTMEVDEHTETSIIRMISGLMYTSRYPKLDLKIGAETLRVEHLCSASGFLKDINFSIHESEIVGITGLVGSGRSLLANCIFGNTKPQSGKFFIKGKETVLHSPFDAIKNGIALVPENRLTDSLINCLDVQSNVSLSSLSRYTYKLALDCNFINQIVTEYIEKLNIEGQSSLDSISNLSGGNQQKLMLAKWMMSRSKIFVLDEPTRGLDIPSRIDIYNSITDLVRKRASVLLISSDIEEILGMCDRVLVLSHGNLVCNLPRKNATKELIISYATELEVLK